MPRRPGTKLKNAPPKSGARKRPASTPIKLAALVKRALKLTGGPEKNLRVVAAGLHTLAEAEDLDPDIRVRAYGELRQLYTSGWWTPDPVTLVRPMTGDDEQDASTISASALQGIVTGQISHRNGAAIIVSANRVMDTAGLARLLRETAPLSAISLGAHAAGDARAAAATGLTPEQVNSSVDETGQIKLPQPRRPLWRLQALQAAQEQASKTIEHAPNGTNGHAKEGE